MPIAPKFKSRKFVLTVGIVALITIVPPVYKLVGVGDAITMAVVGLLGSVGAAYGFVNLQAKKAGVDE